MFKNLFIMKRFIAIFALLVGVVGTIQANPFDTEGKTISISAGCSSHFGGVPIVLSFEHNLYNINDDMGIRVGGVLGWSRETSSYIYGYDYESSFDRYYSCENRYNNISIAFRASYYYSGVERWNFYAGILTGYNIQSGSTNWSNKEDEAKFGNISHPDSGLLLGVVAGVRYELSDSLGIFAEGGYGLSRASIGVAYKFNRQFFGQQ